MLRKIEKSEIARYKKDENNLTYFIEYNIDKITQLLIYD